MNINGESGIDSLTNGMLNNCSTNGSFIVKCDDNTLYDLQTTNNGNNADVLTTDGTGNTYWSAGGGGGGSSTFQDVYDTSLAITNPYIVNTQYGQDLKFKPPGTGGQNNVLTLHTGSINDYGITSDNATFTRTNTDIINVEQIHSLSYPTTVFIDLKNPTQTITITATDLLFNSKSVVNTPYAAPIEGTAFIKTGGTNQQYLMADGSALQYSANSGNSNFYLYNNVSGVMTPPPENGQVGYNNAIQANATIIYISHRTRDTIDIDVFLEQLTTIQDVYIQDQENSLNFIRYNITGTPTIITNDYISIPVLYTTPNGGGTGLTNFGNGRSLLVSFFTNSVEVDTRLSTLDTKTQNQTAIVGSTTFKGTATFNPTFSTAQALNIDYGTSINKINSYQNIGSASLCDLQLNASNYYLNSGDVYIDETHGINSPKFIVPGGSNTEFLKANGTVDNSVYLTASSGLLRYQGYIFNPFQNGTTTITSGNKSYFYTVRINRPSTINGFSTYVATGSDPVRVGIYRSFVRGSPLSNATLVGQSASTPSIIGLPFLSGAIIPVAGQSLNFNSGEYMVIGFSSQGTTNLYFTSSLATTANLDMAFYSLTYYVASGFPVSLTTSQQSSTLLNKICLELY